MPRVAAYGSHYERTVLNLQWEPPEVQVEFANSALAELAEVYTLAFSVVSSFSTTESDAEKSCIGRAYYVGTLCSLVLM